MLSCYVCTSAEFPMDCSDVSVGSQHSEQCDVEFDVCYWKLRSKETTSVYHSICRQIS